MERKVIFPLCWEYLAVLGSAASVWWVRSGLFEPDQAFHVDITGFWVGWLFFEHVTTLAVGFQCKFDEYQLILLKLLLYNRCLLKESFAFLSSFAI